MKRIARFIWETLSSRKNRSVVAAIVAALAAKVGLNVSDELAAAIVAAGAVLAYAIAKEDAAMKTGVSPEEWEAFLDARKAKAAGNPPPAKDA